MLPPSEPSFLLHIYFYINLKFYFLDSTPVNGASEQKTDDMETKPKSPAQEESNENTASSPTR